MFFKKITEIRLPVDGWHPCTLKEFYEISWAVWVKCDDMKVAAKIIKSPWPIVYKLDEVLREKIDPDRIEDLNDSSIFLEAIEPKLREIFAKPGYQSARMEIHRQQQIIPTSGLVPH